jgi:hypothetical protein
MLTPHETSALIDRAGGTSAFGRLLDLDGGPSKGWRQRVHNWRTRGLPQLILLQHFQLIQPLLAPKRRR